ncbi:MAG: aromatic aldehyde oxidoreductase molybdenum-binding subunit [Sphingomonas bacterium]|nr:aromatic aldehyde oxidoreductase molybdenum-binding subunit [Sphingomonas bacterium]
MVIGAALREETEVDPRFGGWLKADLADYIVRVNADIGDIDVSFVDRPDTLLNAVGSKGLGEVSMVGAAAAVANAVFHATGTRIRKMLCGSRICSEPRKSLRQTCRPGRSLN